jgi:hypothetical protein
MQLLDLALQTKPEQQSELAVQDPAIDWHIAQEWSSVLWHWFSVICFAAVISPVSTIPSPFTSTLQHTVSVPK